MKENFDAEYGFEPQDDNRGLIEFLNRLLSNWYWFVLFGLAGTAVAFLMLRYSTPLYKINAKVLITDEQKGNSTVSQNSFMGDFSGLFGGVSSVDNEAEILKTRYLMEQVVKKLNAQVKYYLPGKIRHVEIARPPFHITLSETDTLRAETYNLAKLNNEKGLISKDGFEKEITFGQPVELPRLGKVIFTLDTTAIWSENTYLFEVATFDARVSEYMGRLSVAVNNKLVSIVNLSFDYPIKIMGETILNTIIETYTENNIKAKNIIADSTISFIDSRLIYVGQELNEVEGNIQSFRQSEQLADITAQSQLLLQNASEYINQLTEVETQLNILKSLHGYIIDNENERVVPSSILPNDMVFNALVERYNSILIDRDRRLLSATPENPTIQNLNQQLANLRSDMLNNIENTQSRMEITRDELRRKTGQLQSEVTRVPATERQYLDMARQQQIKQELYVYLLQKREETAISKTANLSNSRLIDPPKAASIPFSPRRSTTLLMGLLVGLIIPFGAIYVKNLLNTRIRNREDISRYTRVPIIGEINHNPSKETLVVTKESRSPIAEQFRALRTNLSFYLGTTGHKSILLTSSMSGEGKSFVSFNLAMILAVSGKRIALMEMDLRKPNLSVKLNKSSNPGFTNYVIDLRLTPQDIIIPSGIHENLFLIGSGPIPPNPAETILNGRLDELMEYLNNSFDYIIIDAPPIGLVTDAQLLSRYADLSLYLVRQGYTYKNQLQIPEDLYANKKMKQLAILVNDIQPKTGFGYGYGYGYYNTEDIPKRWWKFWTKG